MPYAFGKSIDFRFTPVIDNVPVQVAALVSARIFATTPTQLQISTPATLGFLDEVTTWTSEGDYEKKIVFDPITDPDPTSTDDYEVYHVVVNFKYETAGPTVYKAEKILVFRPDGLTSSIEVAVDRLWNREPDFRNLFTEAQLNDCISDAKADIFRWYRGLGYPRKSLLNMDELNDACRYRSLALACMSLYKDRAPHWLEKYKLYKEMYEDALKSAKPLIDTDGDGEPDAEGSSPTTGAVYITR